MSVEERAQARTEEACLPPHLRKKRLRRDEAVEYLERVHGVVIAAATLAKMVTKGGGPRFVKVLRSPLYPTVELDAWVEGRIGEPRSSSSEVA